MWSADGKWIYYVSEFYGTPANIVRMPSTPVGNADDSTVTATRPQQVTFHKDDAVRRARISANGEWIVYECGADLWIASTRESVPPRKLAIEVNADDKVNPERPEIFTNHATEFVVSPDDKHAVFGVHGKLFLTPVSADAQGRPADRRTFDRPRRRLGARRQSQSCSSPTAAATKTFTPSTPTTPTTRDWLRPTSSRPRS